MMSGDFEIDQYEDVIRRTCGVCDKIFENEAQLDVHFREHDIEDDEEDDDSGEDESNFDSSDKFIDNSIIDCKQGIQQELNGIGSSGDSNPFQETQHRDPLHIDKISGISNIYYQIQSGSLIGSHTPYNEENEHTNKHLKLLDDMIEAKKQRARDKARDRQRRNREKRKAEKEDAIEGLIVKGEDAWSMQIKMEPHEEIVRPKQKYNKLKRFEDTLFRREGTKWECMGCASLYDSNHGLYYHLKTTKCGFGDKNRSKPKAKWNQYYTKQDEMFRCLACDKHYETIRGIHYHLSKTSAVCTRDLRGGTSANGGGEGGGGGGDGFEGQDEMEKTLGGSKMNWSSFYTKQDDIFSCLTCSKVYESVNGIHYHLKTSTPCTNTVMVVKQEESKDGGQTSLPSYRRDYRHLYTKGPQGELLCLGCGVQYVSIHGLHCHLNSTSCGFGEKMSKGKVKNSYTGLYRKESDSSFICLGCSTSYSSMHGLHYHLNKTRCGYGEQEKCQPKRNYKGLYARREDNLYCCLGPGCGYSISYLTGMHRHLRECPAAGMCGSIVQEVVQQPEDQQPVKPEPTIINDE